MDDAKNLKLYAIRSHDGKWFRSKGQHGYGPTWRDDVNQAKVYTKIGPARAVVTFWANAYPNIAVPDLIQFEISGIIVLDEKERVAKAKIKKILEKDKQEIRNLQHELLYNTNNRVAIERKIKETTKKLEEKKRNVRKP